VFFSALLGETFPPVLFRFIGILVRGSLLLGHLHFFRICTLPLCLPPFLPFRFSATDVLQIEFLPRDTLSDRLPTAFGI